jgi:Leucine-rich repeat (LRR) protein
MMNKVRDPIQAITNGLPLAVILLAKLMRTMDYNKWEDASKYIMNNNQDDLVRTIVSMGIDDLPDELKSCLLYMAGFPEGSRMDAVHLVRLWKAEGFLTQQFGVEPEELGQRYLKELIFRGLVELVKKKQDDEEAVESVEILGQIHPFFRWEAQRTGFMETQYGGSAPVPHGTRRLALNSRKLPKLEEMKVLKKLRTVLSRSDDGQTQTITTGTFIDNERVGPIGSGNHDAGPFEEVFPKLLRHSIFLRVIDLEDVDIGEELPRHIGELLHLRHLGVRCKALRTVPGTIGNLKRLQILDVRGTQVESLPAAFWTIKSLRRVLVDNDDFFPETAKHLKDSA